MDSSRGTCDSLLGADEAEGGGSSTLTTPSACQRICRQDLRS